MAELAFVNPALRGVNQVTRAQASSALPVQGEAQWQPCALATGSVFVAGVLGATAAARSRRRIRSVRDGIKVHAVDVKQKEAVALRDGQNAELGEVLDQ